MKFSLIVLFSLITLALSSYYDTFNRCNFKDNYYDAKCTPNTPFNWENPRTSATARLVSTPTVTLPFTPVVFGRSISNGLDGGTVNFDDDGCLRFYFSGGYLGFCSYLSGSATSRYLDVLGTGSNERFVATWSDRQLYGNSGTFSTQLKMYKNGNIEILSLDFVNPNGYYVFNGIDLSFNNGDYFGASSFYGSGPGSFIQTVTGYYVVPITPASQCGNAIVETGEACDGGACCSANCTFVSSTTVCRQSAGICDVAETCTGSSAACPANAFALATTSCREDFGICDLNLNRHCTGNSANCAGLPVPDLKQTNIHWPAYNVLSFGSVSGQTGSVGGRMAAKNNVTLGAGFSVGSDIVISQEIPAIVYPSIVPVAFSLIGGHNVHWTSGDLRPSTATSSLRQEDMYAGDSFFGPSYLGDRVLGSNPVGSSLDSDFNDAQAHYAALSDNLALEAPNAVATNQWGGLFFECTGNSHRYVANVDASMFASSTWVSVQPSCVYGANWVINVLGTGDVTLIGGDFPGVAERIVFNVLGSGRNIYVTSGSQESILAPRNTLVQTGGVIAGLVIVGDVAQISSTRNPNCANLLQFSIVVATVGSQSRSNNIASSDFVKVPSFSQIIVGDNCTITGDNTVYTITERIDNQGSLYLRVSPSLAKAIDANAYVTCTVASPQDPRPQDEITVMVSPASTSSNTSVSSASSVVFSFAVVAISIMLML